MAEQGAQGMIGPTGLCSPWCCDAAYCCGHCDDHKDPMDLREDWSHEPDDDSLAERAALAEDELQAAFGMGTTRVNWSFIPQPKDHNGGVWKIENSPGKTTALVCNCGWAYAVEDGMGIKEAGELFAEHVDAS